MVAPAVGVAWPTRGSKRVRVGSDVGRIQSEPGLVSIRTLGDDASRSKALHRRVFQRVASGCRRLLKLLDRLPGQYTVSKLDAFDKFQRKTSRARVAAILLLTPLPCLLINLLIESIPLADPSTGFRGSGFFQLRVFVTAVVSSLSPALMKLNCVPESPVKSLRALVSLAVSQALVCLATNAIISLAAGIFPVPFSQFTSILPMSIAGRLLFYRHLPKDPQFHAQSNKVNLWVSIVVLPVLIYPAFTVAFMALSPTQQFWASFLPPVIKVAVRRVLWTITKDDSDLIGTMICCVGHLYHVLFTAMILQNSKSLVTIAVFVSFSAWKALLNCRYILEDASKLRRARATLQDTLWGDDVLHRTLEISQEMRVSRLLHKNTPSLLVSTYPGYCSTDFLVRHSDAIKSVPLAPIQPRWSKLSRILPWLEMPRLTRQATMPSVGIVSDASLSSFSRSKSTPSAWTIGPRTENPSVHRAAFVSTVATALHQSEIILLRSCISMYMMCFYVIYLVAVFWLPNRKYFATQAATTSFDAVGSTVTQLLLLCGMEFVVFCVYLTLIARHLQVSGLHQVAFVLWSQRVFVQALFMHLPVDILGFPLTHFGNDKLLPIQPEH